MKLTCKASFTVEAAYIMPVVLMCMFIPVWMGIENHEEIKTWIEKQMQVEQKDMILAMYRQDYMKAIGNEWYED